MDCVAHLGNNPSVTAFDASVVLYGAVHLYAGMLPRGRGYPSVGLVVARAREITVERERSLYSRDPLGIVYDIIEG